MEHGAESDAASLASGSQAPHYSEQIIRGLTSGVIALDRDGRVIALNPAACAHLNLTQDEAAAGRLFSEIEALRPFDAVVEELIASGQPLTRREIQVGGQGSVKEKEIGVSASLLEGPETYNGAILLFTDMTERRRFERTANLNAQLASLGELAAGVVHELRNPLAIITGRAELLQRKLAPDDPGRESLDIIIAEAGEVEKTIAQFLRFAKPFELKPTPCGSADVVTRAFALCESKAKEKNVALTWSEGEALPEMFADKARLAEAIANIVGNAIDAVGESGEVHLNISSDASYTQFEILDNGHGIHLEPGEDLLSPFFTKKHDGTGLGLSIAQRIVASQGGSICYANREEGALDLRCGCRPIRVASSSAVVLSKWSRARGTLGSDYL